jgi:hypothetical protein
MQIWFNILKIGREENKAKKQNMYIVKNTTRKLEALKNYQKL